MNTMSAEVLLQGLERPTRRDPCVLPLRLEAVSFVAGGRVLLDRISATLDAGRPSVIIGPNGAGKSLLLRVCHGLLAASTGQIRWADGDGARRRGAQAMVFQRPVLLRRSVAANVDYALAVHRVPRRERPARVAEALHEAGLAGLAGSPARVLSGGEQQRLAIARAWALRPQVLFLDEPTAHLDPPATRAVEQMLEHIAAAGTKIVLATHDFGQAHRLADEILFLHEGRLLECTPVADFFAAPGSPQAAAFVEGRLPE